MRKFKKFLATLFTAIAFPALVLADHAPTDVNMFNQFIDQTNFVVGRGCSGTLIDLEKRYILTADHCVQGNYETIEVEKVDDKGVVTKEKVRKLRTTTVAQLDYASTDVIRTVTYQVKLVKVDRDNDLALLQIISPIPNTLSASISCDAPRRGEQAWVIGNPLGLYSSIHQGVISSVSRNYEGLGFVTENGKQPLMQISAGLIGGNSGGSVYNARGQLIGVPVLGHGTNEILGFAVPVEKIREFVKPELEVCKSA
jgi:S1-C subfamily serine protease